MAVLPRVVAGGGEDDDGEPDKMAIAVQRISRFTGWVKRSIVGLLKGIANFIIRIIKCQSPIRSQEVVLEMTEEKDFQVRQRPFEQSEGCFDN